jgi:hypothetical protein
MESRSDSCFWRERCRVVRESDSRRRRRRRPRIARMCRGWGADPREQTRGKRRQDERRGRHGGRKRGEAGCDLAVVALRLEGRIGARRVIELALALEKLALRATAGSGNHAAGAQVLGDSTERPGERAERRAEEEGSHEGQREGEAERQSQERGGATHAQAAELPSTHAGQNLAPSPSAGKPNGHGRPGPLAASRVTRAGSRGLRSGHSGRLR